MKVIASSQPRKQRKWLFNAPLHKRKNIMSAALSKELKKKYNRNAIAVKKGDTVKVMRGSFKGVSGSITKVDRKKYKVYVEGVRVKKADGTDVEAPIHTSNLMLSELNLEDRERRQVLARNVKEAS